MHAKTSVQIRLKKTEFPVSQRAQHKLTRELDFSWSCQHNASDDAITAYVDMYKEGLPQEAVKAISAATRLGNKKISAAVAADSVAVAEMEVAWLRLTHLQVLRLLLA